MSVAGPTTVDYGDRGLLVTFDHLAPNERWAAAQALQSALLATLGAGVVDVVASFETVFVTFDPAVTDHTGVRALVDDAPAVVATGPAARAFTIPVVYGGDRGPDLAAVAGELDLSPAELVAWHTTATWTVRLRGSPVAAPMMDGPALPSSVARSADPRTRVPAGSVALSGQQCMVYPVASPGGWRLIGQTPLRLFDLADEELVPYRAGDAVTFASVEEQDWDRWTGTLAARADELARAWA